jgi:hypothetical protein
VVFGSVSIAGTPENTSIINLLHGMKIAYSIDKLHLVFIASIRLEGLIMNAKEYLTTQSLSHAQWDVQALTELAVLDGYSFSSEELEAAADELWGSMTEEQLSELVGGGGNGCPNPGPVTVDKSAMEGKKSGGAWTPPPGDVSGNSCFFTRR